MTESTDPPGAANVPLDWQRLPPAAGHVRAVAGALTGLLISGVLAFFATEIVRDLLVRAATMLATIVAGASLGAWLGRARWRHTRWKLDSRGLHVRRGWLWRTEVLVPRSRVQHLDVERGPLERHFGLATLVVHTAGSQTQALRQSGFADASAVALRDALIPDATHDDDAL
jgi:uncharacterized protein